MDQGGTQYPYYNQPQAQQQYVHAEPPQPLQQQQHTINPPSGEGEVWNISQNKASYVVSISVSVTAEMERH